MTTATHPASDTSSECRTVRSKAILVIADRCFRDFGMPLNTLCERMHELEKKRRAAIDEFVPPEVQKQIAQLSSFANLPENLTTNPEFAQRHLMAKSEQLLTEANVNLNVLANRLSLLDSLHFELLAEQNISGPLLRAPSYPPPTTVATQTAPPFFEFNYDQEDQSIPAPVDVVISTPKTDYTTALIGSKLVLSNKGTSNAFFVLQRDSALLFPLQRVAPGHLVQVAINLQLRLFADVTTFFIASAPSFASVVLSHNPYVAIQAPLLKSQRARVDALPHPGLHTRWFHLDTTRGTSGTDEFGKGWNAEEHFVKTFDPQLSAPEEVCIAVGIRNRMTALLQSIKEFHIESTGVWQVSATLTVLE